MNSQRSSLRQIMSGVFALGIVAIIVFFWPIENAQGLSDAPYPNRAIRLIVPFSPGGVSDTLARVIADNLERMHGQPVIVENRPGASGNIASEIVAKSASDGYTLLVAGNSITILPATMGANAVDPVRAFAPVTRLVTQPILIAVNSALTAQTLPEMIALARDAPGKIDYATPGIGTTDHLSAAMLWSRANVELVHIPYANSGQEIKELVQGDVKVAFITIGAVASHLREGKLRALAVTSAHRVAALPQVPTVAEAGYPGFEVLSWYGVLAPIGTPRSIVDQLNRDITAIMQSPGVREKCASLGVEPATDNPDEFAQDIQRLVLYWQPVVRSAGIPSQ